MLNQIILPAGTRTVAVRAIPRLIASAIYPDQPEGADNNLQIDAEHSHKLALREAMMNGLLTPRSHALVPLSMVSDARLKRHNEGLFPGGISYFETVQPDTDEQLQTAVVLVSDLKQYVAQFGLDITVGPMPKMLHSADEQDPPVVPASEVVKAPPVAPAAAPALQHREVEAGLSRREKQIRAIIAAAVAQGYDVLNIPDGGKTLLRTLCKASQPTLFGSGHDPFNDAWKAATTSNPQRLRMANHKKFAGK